MIPGIIVTLEQLLNPKHQALKEENGEFVTSYDLGVSHCYGGFSEYAHVKSEWIIKLPEYLTLENQ